MSMDRCYACKSEFGDAVTRGGVLPGLCAECQRRTVDVRARLARFAPRRFHESYFTDENVDPPVWKPEKNCPRCGVVGYCHGWTHWTHREATIDTVTREWVEGDAYLFCTNCENLVEIPWSRTQSRPVIATFGGRGAQVLPGREVLLVELFCLFLLAVTMAALLL